MAPTPSETLKDIKTRERERERERERLSYLPYPSYPPPIPHTPLPGRGMRDRAGRIVGEGLGIEREDR